MKEKVKRKQEHKREKSNRVMEEVDESKRKRVEPGGRANQDQDFAGLIYQCHISAK